MRVWRKGRNLLHSVFRSGNADGGLDAELRFHLEMETAANRARGMPENEARTEARRSFGMVAQVAEECRDARRTRPLRDAIADGRFALRSYLRNPLGAALVVITLALGIGANTAVFTMLNAVLLRSLPVEKPEQLAYFWQGTPEDKGNSFSYPFYRQFAERSRSFSGVIAWDGRSLSAGIGNSSERAAVELVSGNYFAVLGVSAAAGRVLGVEDDRRPGAHPVAVLSYNYWQRRFGGATTALGSSIRLQGMPYEVIGVAEPGFFGVRVGQSPDLWIPMAMEASTKTGEGWLDSSGWSWLQMMGRLAPGISREAAEAEASTLARAILEEDLGINGVPATALEDWQRARLSQKIFLDEAGRGISSLREQFRTSLWVLAALVGTLLLIACLNLASLFSSRVERRRSEIGTRLALGASRGRIFRQFCLESLLLSLLGGAAAVGVAPLATHTLVALLPAQEGPAYLDLQPDATVLLFTAAVSLLCAAIFGTVPALLASRIGIGNALKAGDATTGRGSRYPIALLSPQFGLSLVMLAAAGLFGLTLVRLQSLDTGFPRESLLLASVEPGATGLKRDAIPAFYTDVLTRMGSIPEVKAAAIGRIRPLSGGLMRESIQVPGRTAGSPGDWDCDVQYVSPGWFRTLEIPLLRGRDLAASDDTNSTKVGVVSESLARRFFPDRDPIGQRIGMGGDANVFIVGVVRDAAYSDPKQPHAEVLYLSAIQNPDLFQQATFFIRHSGSAKRIAGILRTAVRETIPDLPLYAVETMNEVFDERFARERMVAWLAGGFAVLALLLATIGLYGMVSHWASMRRREFGIRLSMGATPADLVGLVARKTAVSLLAGLGIGLGAIAALAPFIEDLLYGVSSRNAVVLAGAALVMIAAGMLAAVLPAREIARTAPMEVLRNE